jgi:asparagine synthase (glutamine-hydrolysing)
MAHSLEARPPLLDHTLVERVFSLPSELKLSRAGTQKQVLKRAVADLLPQAILTRPKRGFAVPIVRWFRRELREPVRALLGSTRCRQRGWLDPAAVAAVVDEHQRGRRDRALPMWSLMMLELWARTFLDAARAVPATRASEVARG